MTKGRPPLAIGTYGRIRTTQMRPGVWQARARFRERSGRTVSVTRTGPTKGRAEANLKAALADRQDAAGVVTSASTIRALAKQWLTAETLNCSPRTREHYEYALDRYILPEMGSLRVAEATTGACDRTIKKINAAHGPGAARSARSVLSGVLDLAKRHDAISTEPLRGVGRIHREQRKRDPRALTAEETTDLCDKLRADERAVWLDVPDLVDFMLFTGVRIGEALALRATSVDAGNAEINATLIRIKGEGLRIQERPKTAAGWRVLALPPSAMLLLDGRRDRRRFRHPSRVLFASPHANALRDLSNTAADLREILDRLGYPWVSSHTFRKTVATRLDQAGWTPRQIADQLGHAQPSMTLDVYMGRKVVNAEAAKVLDR